MKTGIYHDIVGYFGISQVMFKIVTDFSKMLGYFYGDIMGLELASGLRSDQPCRSCVGNGDEFNKAAQAPSAPAVPAPAAGENGARPAPPGAPGQE